MKTISTKLIQEMINYIQKCPWSEVDSIMMKLKDALKTDIPTIVKEEEEKKTKGDTNGKVPT